MITHYPLIILTFTALMILGSGQDWVKAGTTEADFTEDPRQQHIYASPIYIDAVGDGTDITFSFSMNIALPSGLFSTTEETYFTVGKMFLIKVCLTLKQSLLLHLFCL